MINKFLNSYKNLSKEIWLLSVATLINRAGAMVVVFLSLYLREFLQFDESQIGWILAAFGVGSVFGSWLGGKLTDVFGYYKVMCFSLLLTGFAIIGIQYLQTYDQFLIGIFVLVMIADTFRPAAYVSVNDYSSEENKTRSLALVRLAINIGFTIGTAFGGAIIFYWGYPTLFWIDGATAIIASLIIMKFLYQKSKVLKKGEKVDMSLQRPYKDFKFMLFCLAMLFGGIGFIQYVHLFPLYLKEIVHQTELIIGLLIAINGVLIISTEMMLVGHLDGKYSDLKLILVSMILFALSFVILNMSLMLWVIILSIIVLTVGEMIGFPFSSTYALKSAERGNQGEYMSFYTIAFSFGSVLGPKVGTMIIEDYGYTHLWYFVGLLFVIAAGFILWLLLISKKPKTVFLPESRSEDLQ